MSMDLEAVFEKFTDDYLRFEDVQGKRSNRPDLHAFLLLDELQPGTRAIVSASEHDEFWLGIDCDALAEVIAEEQVLELVRCGVMFEDGMGLSLYA